MAAVLYAIFAFGVAVALFAAMLALIELGRRLGARARAADSPGATAGTGIVEGAVFGLLGLIIAFTFAGAATRFDGRRQVVVDETDAIGTTYLRLDVLPAVAQPALRESFRRYVDSRITAYLALPDLAAMQAELVRIAALQAEIAAVAAGQEPGVSPAVRMAPARNWVHMVGYTLAVAVTVYVILDIEFPRYGLIRVDDFDAAMLELRRSMQ